MFIGEALFELLRTNAGVSAIIGNRIYPAILPQDCIYPAISFRKSLLQKDPVLDVRSSGLVKKRYLIFSTAQLVDSPMRAYAQAEQLDEAVRLCLEGFRGIVMNTISPPGSIEIQGIFHVLSQDLYDDSTQTYQTISGYEVWASEIQPNPL